MFSFDLPYHGRSDPKEFWWINEYKLDAKKYFKWVNSFLRSIDDKMNDKPVIVRSSMGADMAVFLS